MIFQCLTLPTPGLYGLQLVSGGMRIKVCFPSTTLLLSIIQCLFKLYFGIKISCLSLFLGGNFNEITVMN